MEIGDYVRTKEYGISKLKELDEPLDVGYGIEKVYFVDGRGHCFIHSFGNFVRKEEIIKSSPNIIDLIEAGDYVNGYLVVEEKYHYENKDFIDFERDVDAGSGYGYQLLAKDIKSIVTKEDFESMEYKVKED